MSPDEKHPIAEKEAPKDAEEETPLTKEEFSAEMDRLAERARAAGLNPIRAMVQTYASQGRAILQGLLAGLENADNAKKKEK